jgi:hypothetical protein
MHTRIHIVIEPREHDAFKSRAQADGQSLSEWLRQAGRERLARAGATRIATSADLRRFFEECDARESGHEPDWTAHLAVIERSRTGGLELT